MEPAELAADREALTTMDPHAPRPNADPSESRAVTLETVFSTLRDPVRRRLLTALTETDPLPIEEFVRAIDRGESTGREIRLHHVHLPKLREADIVDWDPDTGVVRRGPRFEDVEAVVEVLRANEDALPGGWP